MPSNEPKDFLSNRRSSTSSAEEEHELLSSNDDDENRDWTVSARGNGRSKSFTRRFVVLSHIASFLLYTFLAYLIYQRASTLEACARIMSTWSPAFPAIHYTPPTFYHGAISQTNSWRSSPGQRPSPAVDAAWDAIGVGIPGIRLSAEEVGKLGKELEDGGRVQHSIPDEKGGYVAMLEVFHLLHCLDELRKALFYNWEYYSEGYGNGSTAAIQTHHDHCVDAIRMSLMCSGDVTPVTFYDDSNVPQRRLSFPDFSTRHTCRNFDALVKWNWDTARAVMWEDVGDAITYDPKFGDGGGHHH